MSEQWLRSSAFEISINGTNTIQYCYGGVVR